MVRSRSSCSKTKRSFSSITLLAFHGMRLFYTQLPKFCSVRDAPGLICQGCARSVPSGTTPLPLCFSLLLILKGVKVLCFDTLLQVLILEDVSRAMLLDTLRLETARELADRNAVGGRKNLQKSGFKR